MPETGTASPGLGEGYRRVQRGEGQCGVSTGCCKSEAAQGRFLHTCVYFNGNLKGHFDFAVPREIVSTGFPLAGSIPNMLVETKNFQPIPCSCSNQYMPLLQQIQLSLFGQRVTWAFLRLLKYIY